ncbi:SEC10/PgrA surface exclusion domain-containing protein [Lactobacillus amylovorus]|uniref:SEC10/PgrA surface exclusion domain-containing protein n=1 Tax=Lactobacillus amylovorus TaxID=1604 RepID=UPI00232DCC96|nr:SEC10/PgrA surface exclusion domain-containing protein [Lactobacillus amylovorus]MDB6250587.1 SEC10/PgrA surface exclusion domain-containing protein [Lactobacillus amylovorus]
MSNKLSLTKLLALGATSTALLGGALMANSNTVDASSSIVLLRFKHNAYRYNKNGERIGKGYICKGSTYYSKGAYRIHGKKYHKLETKGNIFIKDSNLTARRLTQQVTLKHNSALYNKNGKRIGKKVLPKGESYFIYGTRRIQGRKYYQVGDKEFIKASNASAPFSTYHQDNNVDNGNSNTTDTSTNTNISTVTNYNNASSTTNNSQQSQQTQSGSNTTINVGGGDNKGSQTSKPSTNTNNGNHSSNNQGHSQVNNQDHSSSTTPDHTYRNYVELPAGYLETVKKADWKKTEVPDDLIFKGVAMNTFHSESKADDEMKIDSANLTPSQAYEINDFALRLINHVREQNGQKPWYYSNRSYAIAKRVAYLYEQDHMGLSTWHDQKALNEIDKEAGINSAELMGGDFVNNPEDYLNTMTDLKHAVYSDVVAMLFSTVELEHAHIMLTWNSTTNSTTYMGLAISWQEKNKLGYQEHSDHFIAY